MKKFLFGVILALVGISAYFNLDDGAKRVEEKKVVVQDTIYGDTVVVNVRDTVFYDVKWLRGLFENSNKAYFRNYGDGYEVAYPEFMNKVVQNKGERNMKFEFHDISMVVRTYDDETEMSVMEKYEGLNMGAVTKSVADSSFLLAGRCGKYRLYFEKDIKLKSRTWMYLRVEFPKEYAWAVDPLLHYVKDYQP